MWLRLISNRARWASLHGSVVKLAEAMIRSLHFVPFRRDGHPVFVRSTVDVPILPPEKLPTEHLPFPSLRRPKNIDHVSLAISLLWVLCRISNPGPAVMGGLKTTEVAQLPLTGHRESQLPRQTVDALFEQFKRADFFSLDDSYVSLVIDPPRTEVGVSFDGHQMKVTELMGEEPGMPDGVVRLEQALDKATNSKQWITGPSSTFIEAAKTHPCK